MRILSDVIARVRSLLFRGRQDRELEEELRHHLEREEQERARNGSTDARREALVALGGVERVKDDVRAARGVMGLDTLIADLRFALRALGRNPGFTLAVLVVLGLGIGASTTVFSVVDTVLLSELPYPDAGRLVRVVQQSPRGRMWQLSTVDYQAIRAQQQSFDAFGVVRGGVVSLSGAGTPERVQAAWADAGFFQATGLHAAAGRFIEPGDEPGSAPPVVVVSHETASRLLGGVTAALGKSITIDGVAHSVVGVLPADHPEVFGSRAALWPALRVGAPTRRGPFWLRGFGRLRDGVTEAQAAQDLAGISERLFPVWATSFQDQSVHFATITLRESVIGRADRPMSVFAGAVALVLLIAIANVATLVLVRFSARDHELAVRAALGATRRRLARLVLTECIALTAIAGAAGIATASLGVGFAVRLMANVPRIAEVALGGRGVAFAVIAALVSGVLISLPPAWGILAGRSAGSLRADARRGGTSRHTNAVRGVLVAAEFALALPLLVGAGLLLNSFLRLQRVYPGFVVGGAVSLDIALPSARYADPADVQAFWARLEARVRSIPGYDSAGLSGTMPPDNGGDVNNFDLLDQPTPAGTSQPVVPWGVVTTGYFGAMRIPLIEGRLFTSGDSATAPPVAVASRAWARHWYPRGSAIGKQMYNGGCNTCPPTTIVGIVGDVKYLGLAGEGEAVYAPVAQDNPTFMTLVVRTRAAAPEAFRALRGAVAAVDPELAPAGRTLQDRMEASLIAPQRWTQVVGGFGAAALLLAAIGIFGLMSFVVRQRRRELGVRLALGAEPASLMRLIVGRGMRYALLGSAVGFGLAVLEGRWLRSLLFGVGAMDPTTIVVAAAVLLAVALLACWVPGLRAARIKPVEVLASE